VRRLVVIGIEPDQAIPSQVPILGTLELGAVNREIVTALNPSKLRTEVLNKVGAQRFCLALNCHKISFQFINSVPIAFEGLNLGHSGLVLFHKRLGVFTHNTGLLNGLQPPLDLSRFNPQLFNAAHANNPLISARMDLA